jgi:hypothetical protein
LWLTYSRPAVEVDEEVVAVALGACAGMRPVRVMRCRKEPEIRFPAKGAPGDTFSLVRVGEPGLVVVVVFVVVVVLEA